MTVQILLLRYFGELHFFSCHGCIFNFICFNYGLKVYTKDEEARINLPKSSEGKNKFPVVMSAPRQFDSPYNKNSTVQK